MNRAEIFKLDNKSLLKLINQKHDVKLRSLTDQESLSQVWLIVTSLLKEGWRIDIQAYEKKIKVDGILLNQGRPVTVFAQYGTLPEFDTVVEGICRLALIIAEET